MSTLITLIILSALLSLISGQSSLPVFVVDFDESASTRYEAIFRHYREGIIEMENDLMHSIAPAYRTLFQENTERFRESNPEAYAAMQSLSLITSLPLWQTLLVNSVVDITSFCTSVVGRTAEGAVIHGRNLDFDFPSVLQSLTHRVLVRVAGRTVGEAVCLAGYVGFYTALRYEGFTASYNVRMYPHNDMDEIVRNIEREWESGVLPAAQAIQQAVLHNASYRAAVDYLSTQHVNTPCYIILAGTNAAASNGNNKDNDGGVVLTRDPYGLNHTQYLDREDNWYIAQTNTDWWLVPDERYNATVNYLDALGRERLTMETLVSEVLNKTGVVQWITIFTASMSAEKSLLDVYLTPLP